MQDNYVGDIGDYGKYGLLRNVTAAGLQLAVNWYRVVLPPSNEQDDGECISCSKKPKQKDGKYTSYLEHPEKYRHYDPELFDCLAGIVHGQKRRLEEIETSGVLSATFFSDTLNLPPPIDMASDSTAGHCRGGCRVPRSGQRPGDRKNA